MEGRGGRRRARRPPTLPFYPQPAGLKSKRFMKAMLAQLRAAGTARAVPGVQGKSFGFQLTDAGKAVASRRA